MSDGRPKGFPSTRLESSRPTTWPSPIRDWQDDNFERQEQHSGGIGISIAGDKDRRYPAGWAKKTRVLMMTARQEKDQDGSGVGGLSGRVYPAIWATKTRTQKQRYWQRRRRWGRRALQPEWPNIPRCGNVEKSEEEMAEMWWTEGASHRPFGRVGTSSNRRRRRRQAFARPLVVPPQFSLL